MKMGFIVAAFILIVTLLLAADYYHPNWYYPAEKPRCDSSKMLMITC